MAVYGATKKDAMRVGRLIDYSRENGLASGVEKAHRDSDRIETPEKLESRAALLEDAGFSALARPFRARLDWLNAQGVF